MMTTMMMSLSIFNTFQSGGVRADWRCSGWIVMIIIMTVGDAKDAR